ncbi:MAG: glycoside hydrolase family 28 protein, partial [Planctomycetota bacterium]
MGTFRNWIPVVVVCLLTVNRASGTEAVYDVRDYGAKADGKVLSTRAIQSAIDECAAAGGGTVYFPPGKWLSGTLYLSDHVTLRLDSGSTLLGSRDPNDYARRHGDFSSWSLVAGKDLRHIAIRGSGTIDVQGSAFRWKDRPRPKGMYIESCRDITIEGVSMRSAGSWMQHYVDCERLTVRDISVFNHVAYNNDGLNIDSCRDVRITGCVIDSDDDAIVLKSRSLKPCEN